MGRRSIPRALISSLYYKPHQSPNPNPNPRFFTTAAFSFIPDHDFPESIAISTKDLFLGFASGLIRPNIKDSQLPTNGNAVYLIEEKGEWVEKLVRDSANGEVIWEQCVRDVEAEKVRRKVTSPGFSFSAAGLLFPYHLGAAQLLLEKGYIKDTTPLAGSSAGAIVSAVVASGKGMQDALQVAKILAEDCRINGTAFRLGEVLRDGLNNFLPDDIHTKCNGRVRVGITQLFWKPKGLLVDQFDSKEDLINALFTSSFIPGYLSPKPATLFRNRLCIDGALTLFMPPTSASKTIRICAFPVNGIGLKGIGISPDLNAEKRATAIQLFNWALEPADDQMLGKLYDFGYSDASAWADQNPVESTVTDEDSPSSP